MPKILHEPRENILSAAQKELREKGVRGFNIRDVAKLSGVAIGTIYNYYGDKYNLISVVCKSFFDAEIAAQIERYPEGRPLEKGVECLYIALQEFKNEHSEALGAILEGRVGEEDLFLEGTLKLLDKALESAKKSLSDEEKIFVASNILWAALKEEAPLELLQRVALFLAK